jgi:predicted ATPase
MIKSIEVKNFKAFLHETVPVSTLNLFTGINGVGKSTIIQILLLIRQSFDKGLFPNKGILLNGELVRLGRGSDVLNIHSDEKEISFKIEFNLSPSIEFSLSYEQDNDYLKIKSKPSNIPESSAPALFTQSFKYLSAERISPKSSYSASLYDVEQKRSLGIHGEYTSLFLARYQREKVTSTQLLHPNTISDDLLSQVTLWLKEISPGISVKSNHIPEVESARIAYQYEYSKNLTPEFTPTNIGFGITYVLPVVTCILSSKPGDILLIENPESHLHPAGQSKLGELFFRAAISGIQIITETHSDHFLNGIRVAVKNHGDLSNLIKILYFKRNESSEKHATTIEYPKLTNDGRIENWPSGFFDQSINDLNELMGL